jgi:outer membrane receptor protein involved in Fe transport
MPTPPRFLRAYATALLLVSTVLLTAASHAQTTAEPPGSVAGRVVDRASGQGSEGATVTLFAPGFAPREARTDAQGTFALRDVPAGRYEVRFTKPGFGEVREAVVVAAGQEVRANASLEAETAAVPPEPEPSDVEEFVVIASPAAEILAASRMDADELINTLGAAEFDKLAIGDVAEALKFVAGVNVVEGQFAVIRGLEDRYSSTLYNGAPVPSPDPDRQSVQLDLFPSDIVSDLVVAKTFGPELPSNSSGGSIDILTHDYPEEFTFKLSAGTGFSENAADRFVELVGGSPIGEETSSLSDVLESDFAASLGGRGSLAEREVRFKALVANEVDYETKEGFQEGREPRRSQGAPVPISGDLSLGELSLSDGRFDLTESERAEQRTGYLGLGFDLDEGGSHTLDSSVFYTSREDEIVQLKENGFFPDLDYGVLAAKQMNGDDIVDTDFDGVATATSWIARSVRANPFEFANRGPLFFSSFAESEAFERERDLLLAQLNGDHQVGMIDGLHFDWAANWAETTQDERSRGARFFFEPDDPTQIPTEFPARLHDLGAGQFAVNSGIFASRNEIDESQAFGRLGADFTFTPFDAVTFELRTGGWYESAERDVFSSFLENPTRGGSSQFVIFADTPEELGGTIFDELDTQADGQPSFTRETTNEANREIFAWNLGSKTTLWDDLDLLAGFRLEDILIESINDPFTGELRFGAPATFPEVYLFLDRLDNPARGEVLSPPPPGTFFNDQLLGIQVPVDPVTGLVDLTDRAAIEAVINGEIDELRFLPALGFTYRLLEGLSFRSAYSQTVARPSFREMGFYVSVEPGTDDLIVGNPQLKLSDVESWDARMEYTWGESGDLAALSVFYKTIEDPIESIVVRNPLNQEGSSSALFRTFFNNPSEADLLGIELELRKSFGFLVPELGEYFSIGGNFTYIDAEVDRTDAELARSASFFGVAPGDEARFGGLEKSRRLFGQPEWIANLDLGYDNPDSGTKATLVFFAISDVLDAAGTAAINPDNSVLSFTLDRYVGSFYQLDLNVSQTWQLDFLRGELTLKLSAKNLTDSPRKVIYDPEQTRSEIEEREFKVGRDLSLSLTYTF